MISLSRSPIVIQSLVLLAKICLVIDTSMAHVAQTQLFTDWESKMSEVYAKCKEEKSCVGVSYDFKCMEHRTCDYLLKYSANPTLRVFDFTLIGSHLLSNSENKYVAVGFGGQNRMFENAVVSCIKHRSQHRIQLSWNNDNRRNIVDKVPQSALTPGEIVMNEDGKQLMCTFSLNMTFSLFGISFNLNTSPYYILFAQGAAKSLETISYHYPLGSTITPVSINLMSAADLNGFPPYKKGLTRIRLHTCGFVLVFIFLIPTSGMFARFFKESYIDRRICNKRVWFTIHWLSSLMAVVLIIGAYVVVSDYKVRIKSDKSDLHYQLGATTSFSTIAVATIGVLIGCVHPTSCLRRLFSSLHCIFGTVVYILGVIQIFLSVWTKPYFLNYCSLTEFLVVFWLLIHFLLYGILTLVLYRRDRIDARIQQLQTLQGMISATHKNSIKRFRGPDVTLTGRGLNRRYDALGRISSTNLEKTVEDLERTARIIEHINYNKMIIEKLYKLNVNTKQRKKKGMKEVIENKKEDLQRLQVVQPIDHSRIFQKSIKQDPKTTQPTQVKPKSPRSSVNVNKPHNSSLKPQNNKNTWPNTNNVKSSTATDIKKVPESHPNKPIPPNLRVQVQLPKKYEKNPKNQAKRSVSSKGTNKTNTTTPTTTATTTRGGSGGLKPIVSPSPAHAQISEKDATTYTPPPSEDDDSDDGSESDNSDENPQIHYYSPRSTIDHSEYFDDNRHSHFQRRRNSSANPEDPEDFLNNFYPVRRPLDPYRAFLQYPLQPQLGEYQHSTVAAFLLGLFTFMSLTMTILIIYLTYPDLTHPGCSQANAFLVFQQWR